MNDSIQFLTIDDILETHSMQIEKYGGSQGIRDLGLLESAIAQPEASFGSSYLHSFPFEMAAAYLFHIAMNHPFVDGNKRVGLEAALLFLEVNSISIEASDDEFVQLVLDTTVGKIDKQGIAEFFRSHSD